jgi:hypothetical protein
MLTVCGSHAGLAPQLQSGTFGAHAQSVTAHGCVHAWHTMPEAHSASTEQCAGVQPYSSVVTHGSGSGHAAPGAQGGVEAQLPEAPTTLHSNPTPHAGPVPQPGCGATMALDSELNRNTAEAANVAGRKRS